MTKLKEQIAPHYLRPLESRLTRGLRLEEAWDRYSSGSIPLSQLLEADRQLDGIPGIEANLWNRILRALRIR